MANVPISAFTVPANTVGIGATGYSLTGSASASFMDLAGTWNTSGTPTAIKLNITDTASNAASLLMDLQVGGSTKFNVNKSGHIRATASASAYLFQDDIATWSFSTIGNGGVPQVSIKPGSFQANSTSFFGFANSVNSNGGIDTILTRRGAANLRLGAADAAAPVAQTLSVQSGVTGASATTVSISGTALTIAGTVTGTIAIGHAVTGTGVSAGTLITAGSGTSWTVNNSQTVGPITAYFNSVGRDFTITGNQASGPSAGGSIVFQVAPAGAAATTAQNALATALTINSASQVVFSSGSASAPSITFDTANTGIYGGSNAINFTRGGSRVASIDPNSFVFFSAGANISMADAGGSADVRLFRDDANKLALRNGTAAQTFNVYNTFTNASNYERLNVSWSANVATIQTQGAGTGATNRRLDVFSGGQLNLGSQAGSSLFLFTNGSARWYVDGASGHLLANTDNTVDIGASGASRPRTIYAGTNLVFGGELQAASTARIYATTGEFRVRSAGAFQFSSDTTGFGTPDVAITRSAANIVKITNASTGGGSVEMQEMTAPAAPAANGVRIYAVDNGSGKTQLMAIFATGAAQQIAIEP